MPDRRSARAPIRSRELRDRSPAAAADLRDGEVPRSSEIPFVECLSPHSRPCAHHALTASLLCRSRLRRRPPSGSLPDVMREHGDIWIPMPKILLSRTRESAGHSTRVIGVGVAPSPPSCSRRGCSTRSPSSPTPSSSAGDGRCQAPTTRRSSSTSSSGPHFKSAVTMHRYAMSGAGTSAEQDVAVILGGSRPSRRDRASVRADRGVRDCPRSRSPRI